MIVHVAIADAIENDHKSVMILTFALFFSLSFPHYLGASWNMLIWTFGCPIGQKQTHNILVTYLFAKALVPSKSKFLPVFHALTVRDTTSFSAGHWSAKILNINFCQFFTH